jgi:hypothetical protein
VNGPGPDLIVFENAVSSSRAHHASTVRRAGVVSVSADGLTWRTFACARDAAPYFAGCAGVYPVFATEAASALEPSTTPIEQLVGVPLDDFSRPPARAAMPSTWRTWASRPHGSSASRQATAWPGSTGSAASTSTPRPRSIPSRTAGIADGDGDGIVDAADACPLVPDPAQLDADTDSIGDACEGEPPPEDTDGDGTPDAFDPCPHDPRCGSLCSRFLLGRSFIPPERAAAHVRPAGRPLGCRCRQGSSAATLLVAIAPEVEAGSVRVRVGRQDVTAAFGPFVPGSIRRIDVPVDRRVIRVRLRARSKRTTTPRLRDRDSFRFVVPTTKG